MDFLHAINHHLSFQKSFLWQFWFLYLVILISNNPDLINWVNVFIKQNLKTTYWFCECKKSRFDKLCKSIFKTEFETEFMDFVSPKNQDLIN